MAGSQQVTAKPSTHSAMNSPQSVAPPDSTAPNLISPAERRLVDRVFARWHAAISGACRLSSVPAAFLGALTANESGGDSQARRFEPAVFAHLEAVARGERAAYGSITRAVLEREMEKANSGSQKPEEANAAATDLKLEISDLTAEDRNNSTSQISGSGAGREQVLHELATSWGLTQIMGYHLIGRPEAVSRLLQPDFHFHFALELLAGFAHEFQLDPASDFEEMFHCWNTGQPYGPPRGPATYDLIR